MNSLKVLPYVDLSATSVGTSSEFSFYLVPIASGSSSLGRIVSGLPGDDLTFLRAIKTYMAVSRDRSVPHPHRLRFLFRSYITSILAPVVAVGGMHDAGRRIGIIWSAVTIGAVSGPPITSGLPGSRD